VGRGKVERARSPDRPFVQHLPAVQEVHHQPRVFHAHFRACHKNFIILFTNAGYLKSILGEFLRIYYFIYFLMFLNQIFDFSEF